MDAVLKSIEIISDTEYKIAESFKSETTGRVKELCAKFPMR